MTWHSATLYFVTMVGVRLMYYETVAISKCFQFIEDHDSGGDDFNSGKHVSYITSQNGSHLDISHEYELSKCCKPLDSCPGLFF